MEAFISLKNSPISELIVDYPRKHKPFPLILNASTGTNEIKCDIVRMPCQTDAEGEKKSMPAASRQLLKHEKSYTSFLVEMQAMVCTIDYFDAYL